MFSICLIRAIKFAWKENQNKESVDNNVISNLDYVNVSFAPLLLVPVDIFWGEFYHVGHLSYRKIELEPSELWNPWVLFAVFNYISNSLTNWYLTKDKSSVDENKSTDY